jgi:hypothetical protein
MLVCVFFSHFAHGTAGAARIRHSPRPLISSARKFTQTSGGSRRENAKLCCSKFESGMTTSESIRENAGSCAVISPPSTRPCAWRGGVGGGGSISLLSGSEFAEAPPTPPRRFAGGAEACDGGPLENRISTVIARTGRPRIPETLMIRSGSRGVLDTPAGACHRARRRRDPVAGYDGSLWGK